MPVSWFCYTRTTNLRQNLRAIITLNSCCAASLPPREADGFLHHIPVGSWGNRFTEHRDVIGAERRRKDVLGYTAEKTTCSTATSEGFNSDVANSMTWNDCVPT